MAIAALVTLTPEPGCEEELFRRLSEVLADVRAEPGNLVAIALRDPQMPDKVFEFAVYKDQAAIEAHRAADHSVKKGPWVQEVMAGPLEAHYFETVGWPVDD